ncbi:MAG: hypothetical protein H6713_12110 [Myxococcales bacterium]|nr:hypothetical protein [Myxococcales bacterium]
MGARREQGSGARSRADEHAGRASARGVGEHAGLTPGSTASSTWRASAGVV